MEVNPLLVMLVVVAVLTVVSRIASFLGGMLQEAEKQAREKRRELERERRALEGLPGGPPPPSPEAERSETRQELEQLFALLTGTPPPRRQPAPPRRPAPARPAPPPRPAVVVRPSALERHGGDLSAHHLRSAVEDGLQPEHPGQGLRPGHPGQGLRPGHSGQGLRPGAPAAPAPYVMGGDRHLEPTLTTAALTDLAGGSLAVAERAQRIAVHLDELPPLARGVLWGELLGPPLSQRGPRVRRGVRRV